MLMSGDRLGEVGVQAAALEAAGLADREEPLDGSIAVLGLGAVARFAPQHRGGSRHPRRLRRAGTRRDPSPRCRVDAARQDVELRVPAATHQSSHLRAIDEAIAMIAEITATTVPKRSAEQTVRDAAADFESFYASDGRGDRAARRRDPRRRDRLQGHPDGQARAGAAGRAQRQGRVGQQETDGDRRRGP